MNIYTNTGMYKKNNNLFKKKKKRRSDGTQLQLIHFYFSEGTVVHIYIYIRLEKQEENRRKENQFTDTKKHFKQSA